MVTKGFRAIGASYEWLLKGYKQLGEVAIGYKKVRPNSKVAKN